jgi:hypothetical protein
MKIRALANGNVIEAHEDAAKELIAAGIYEAVDEKKDKADDAGPAKRHKSRK